MSKLKKNRIPPDHARQAELSERLTNRIKGAIYNAGYNQGSLAKSLGIPPSTLNQWVLNPMRMKIGDWYTICNATGMDVNTLSEEAINR